MSKLVGIFLLGILAGWIIEWIFVRLFVPNTGKKLKSRLEASQQENTTLQQQNSELQTSLKSAQAENTRLSQQVAEAQSAAEAAAAATKEAEAAAATAPVEDAAGQAEGNTVVVEEATAGQQPGGGAASAEETVKQATEGTVPVAAETSTSADEDLTRINGVGPKLAEAMQAAGINTYAQIAGMTEEELNGRLAATGVRYVKASVKSWPEQAKFAANADWDGLKGYQESLKK